MLRCRLPVSGGPLRSRGMPMGRLLNAPVPLKLLGRLPGARPTPPVATEVGLTDTPLEVDPPPASLVDSLLGQDVDMSELGGGGDPLEGPEGLVPGDEDSWVELTGAAPRRSSATGIKQAMAQAGRLETPPPAFEIAAFPWDVGSLNFNGWWCSDIDMRSVKLSLTVLIMRRYHVLPVQEAHVELANLRAVRRWADTHEFEVFVGLNTLAWDMGCIDVLDPAAQVRPWGGVVVLVRRRVASLYRLEHHGLEQRHLQMVEFVPREMAAGENTGSNEFRPAGADP